MRLPLNCTVDYINDFLTPTEAAELYTLLIGQYQIDQARMIIEAGGQLIETDSFKILFLIDELIESNSHPEQIHGKNHPFTGKMAELKQKVEAFAEMEFDLAMCLYYPDGNFYAPYHFDQQTSGHNTILPSISLGEVRAFSFKENDTGECYSMDLADGSLLIMGDYCQARYEHSLLKDPKYKHGRINITFRDRKFK